MIHSKDRFKTGYHNSTAASSSRNTFDSAAVASSCHGLLSPYRKNGRYSADSRVQLTHHLDKRDGVSEKQSVRERLRSGKAEHSRMQIENENHREVEIR